MNKTSEDEATAVTDALNRIVASAGIDPTPFRFDAVCKPDGGIVVKFNPHRHDARTDLGLSGSIVLTEREAAAIALTRTYKPPRLVEIVGTTSVYYVGGDLPSLAAFEIDNIVALVTGQDDEDQRRLSTVITS